MLGPKRDPLPPTRQRVGGVLRVGVPHDVTSVTASHTSAGRVRRDARAAGPVFERLPPTPWPAVTVSGRPRQQLPPRRCAHPGPPSDRRATVAASGSRPGQPRHVDRRHCDHDVLLLALDAGEPPSGVAASRKLHDGSATGGNGSNVPRDHDNRPDSAQEKSVLNPSIISLKSLPTLRESESGSTVGPARLVIRRQ